MYLKWLHHSYPLSAMLKRTVPITQLVAGASTWTWRLKATNPNRRSTLFIQTAQILKSLDSNQLGARLLCLNLLVAHCWQQQSAQSPRVVVPTPDQETLNHPLRDGKQLYSSHTRKRNTCLSIQEVKRSSKYLNTEQPRAWSAANSAASELLVVC